VKTIGVLTTAVATALAVCAAVVLVQSLPDIRRYLKIRAM
jgi:hypothetical protein